MGLVNISEDKSSSHAGLFEALSIEHYLKNKPPKSFIDVLKDFAGVGIRSFSINQQKQSKLAFIEEKILYFLNPTDSFLEDLLVHDEKIPSEKLFFTYKGPQLLAFKAHTRKYIPEFNILSVFGFEAPKYFIEKNVFIGFSEFSAFQIINRKDYDDYFLYVLSHENLEKIRNL